MDVSGLSWIMPNGTVAPGKVWPSPPVPIMGSTAAQPALAAGVAAWDADRPPSHVVAMSSSAAPQAVRSGDGETDDMDAPLGLASIGAEINTRRACGHAVLHDALGVGSVDGKDGRRVGRTAATPRAFQHASRRDDQDTPAMTRHTASTRTALVVINGVFLMWGLMTVLNDILIPHLKTLFTLNYFQAMLVQFTFFGAYFIMSVPCGAVLARVGYRATIILGLLVAALGALLFLPAAMLASYPVFLGAFFILATGITGLQVAANPYVSLLGDEKLASSRLNLAQMFNSLGTVIGPYVIGPLILTGSTLGAVALAKLPEAQQVAYRLEQARLVQGPYLGLALVMIVLAVAIWLFHLPPLKTDGGTQAGSEHRLRDALRHPHVAFGVVAIFVYVGAEVTIGSFMINYISLPQIGAIDPATATRYVALYWGGAMVGRFVGWLL